MSTRTWKTLAAVGCLLVSGLFVAAVALNEVRDGADVDVAILAGLGVWLFVGGAAAAFAATFPE